MAERAQLGPQVGPRAREDLRGAPLYNDVTFIDEFLTLEFCVEQKLFVTGRAKDGEPRSRAASSRRSRRRSSSSSRTAAIRSSRSWTPTTRTAASCSSRTATPASTCGSTGRERSWGTWSASGSGPSGSRRRSAQQRRAPGPRRREADSRRPRPGRVEVEISVALGARSPGTHREPHSRVETEQKITTPRFFREELCFGGRRALFRRKRPRRIVQGARSGRRRG